LGGEESKGTDGDGRHAIHKPEGERKGEIRAFLCGRDGEHGDDGHTGTNRSNEKPSNAQPTSGRHELVDERHKIKHKEPEKPRMAVEIRKLWRERRTRQAKKEETTQRGIKAENELRGTHKTREKEGD
jgi:hypothetical protein